MVNILFEPEDSTTVTLPIHSIIPVNINWDGINSSNGKMCADGTYYYVCDVYQQTLVGTVKSNKPLSGFIHLYK